MARLIHFVMGSQSLQQNGFGTLENYEFKNNPQIVTATARPGTFHSSLELVGFELRVKGVILKQGQGHLNIRC